MQIKYKIGKDFIPEMHPKVETCRVHFISLA